MIHRACFGSLERFIGIITENYAGAFPTWLAPVQVKLIPVNNEFHLDYASKLKEELEANGIRVEIDSRDEKLGYKMREAQIKKIPYQLVIGDKEVSENTVNVRKYGETATVSMKVEDFIKQIKEQIKNFK